MNSAASGPNLRLTRRAVLTAGAGLVVSFGMPVAAEEGLAQSAGPSATRLDSWLAIGPDGQVVASVGKIDAGLGLPTALAQLVADELGVAIERVQIRMGDTATTVDQRGTGSSNGITNGGSVIRSAAAQARVFLIERAASQWQLPREQLGVREGRVFVLAQPQRSVGYGELLAAGRFDLALDPKANPALRDSADYRYVGRPVPRIDIPAKVTAQFRYLVDFRLPGMLHARVVRPPTAGAQLLGLEQLPVNAGFVQLVRLGNFVAVVAEREEQALEASRQLKLRWSPPGFAFPASYDALYQELRSGPAQSSKVERSQGDPDAAIAAAAHSVEAWYEYPFQSHACMGPACAVAQVEAGAVTVWAGGQKPYPLRKAVAQLLGRSAAQVRVIWLPGPGSYGMNDADDAAIDAVLIAREVGRPVRVQYQRADATAWDPKGPPGVFRVRAGLTADGRIAGFDFHSRGYSGRLRPSGTANFGDSLASQLIGGYRTHGQALYQVPVETYPFEHQRASGDLLDWNRALVTGLRTAHLRDPDGMATCFASESLMDEAALAAGVDPVAFRLRHLSDARHAAVVRAAAQKAGWNPRVGANPRDPQAKTWHGRGIAYAPRNGSLVAIVAEVEVEPASGNWRATRFVVAHDCGMVINPLSLEHVIESNILMSLSRARHEEVRFDQRSVTSVDWTSYPILDMTEVPDAIDVVLVGNQPGRSYGAGEPSTRPVAAALANALFDATGVRLRRVPFTPQRLLAALQARGAA